MDGGEMDPLPGARAIGVRQEGKLGEQALGVGKLGGEGDELGEILQPVGRIGVLLFDIGAVEALDDLLDLGRG